MAPETPRHRPFTRRQQRQNARFLAALRRTGNVRLACRELGVHRACYTKRRAKCAAFATNWDIALAAAHAAFKLAGGERLPAAASPLPAFREDRSRPWPCPGDRAARSMGVGPSSFRTRGGEPFIVRRANGRLQLRLAPPGWMTNAAEQAFYAALSASANVRLACAAIGFAHTTVYRRRDRWVGFRARMGQALQVGYDRLEYVVMERTLAAIHGAQPEQAWLGAMIRNNPLPPLSFGQAFQTLCLHRNTCRLDGARPPGRRSKVEHNVHAAMFAIGRNIDALQRAEHYELTGTWTLPGETDAEAPKLPPLSQVSGWGAKVEVSYHPERALFGGWRIDDHKKREAGKS